MRAASSAVGVSAPAPLRARRTRRNLIRAASGEVEPAPPDASTSVVLGANGRTGREIVRSLLRRKMAVRACTRSGTFDARELLGDDATGTVVPWTSPLLQTAMADVTRPETVATATRGARAVFFACTAPANGEPDLVDRKGLVDVARACIENNVSRLVVISGAGVTKTSSPAYGFLNAFGGRMDAKRVAEDELRDTYRAAAAAGRTKGDVAYTIVRPSGLLNGPGKGVRALAVNQGDEAAGFIDRVDAAETAVEASANPACLNVTFEVYDAGTAVPTRYLSVADVLSDPILRAVASVVTGAAFGGIGGGRGEGGAGDDARARATLRERRGGDWPTLLSNLDPDP